MTGLASTFRTLDILHRRRNFSPESLGVEKRGLYGHVFGVRIPAWVIFHAILGYFLLGAGLGAILLRFPFKFVRRFRYLHPYFGAGWVLGTVYMPISAIWCVYSFPGWDIIAFFIFSMYITITAGYIFIRIFQKRKSHFSLTVSTAPAEKMPKRDRGWKWAHGTFMIYSFVMLLGAGISFPLRALDDYKVI